MEKPIHILIIEDNESDAELIVRHLMKAERNITYEIVDNDLQMKSALEFHQCDIVICDYSLPQFNAVEALRKFKEFQIDIPFIVVSGAVGEETAVEVMKAGAHDYVMKDNLTRLVPVFHRELAEAEMRRKHKTAEKQILLQAQLLDLISQSVIMVDKSNIITYWNKASEYLYGWSADEVIGLNLKEVLIQHASVHAFSHDIKKSMFKGENWSFEMTVIKKDGSSVPIFTTHTPILDQNGELNAVIGISYDIIERKKTEEAMLRKIEELATSNEELNRINRVTISREMRMIELKQLCNDYASLLGIDRPFPLAFLKETDHQKRQRHD
ncbi:MAG: PAS domain S-box protein [Bacteroidota bacterium]|nr:PAS domain S-box protein [Bacteroidota bacterium]